MIPTGTLEPDVDRAKHPDASPLRLAFGFTYADLYGHPGLKRLDEVFRGSLREADAALSERFEAYRASRGASLHGPAESTLLIEVSRHIERFVAALFGIGDATAPLYAVADVERTVMRTRKELWRKRGAKLLGKIDDVVRARSVMATVLEAVSGLREEQVEDEPHVARAVVPLLDLEDRCAKVLAKGGAVVTADELARVDAWRVAMADRSDARDALGPRPTEMRRPCSWRG
jgi:hypothetical protein